MPMNTGNFFRVDRRIWAAVCELGMNPAVAYLLLAQGTDANNRLTRWSATSLKTHTGVSWERGKPAIDQFIELGLAKHDESQHVLQRRLERRRDDRGKSSAFG